MVALDADRFYVGNDHGATNALLQWLEGAVSLVVALPTSTVVFWDGGQFRTVATGIEMANGLALDRTRRRLYVAATRARKLYAFPWDPDRPEQPLANAGEIELPGCPDNLEWDEDGNLWISADPSFLKVALYVLGLSHTAPFQILSITFGSGTPLVEEVWRDDSGETISASSVACTACAINATASLKEG